MDAVWGPPGWQVRAESGKGIWQEMDLPAYVLAQGPRRALPLLSLGAGGLHLTWKQETDLMKACLKTHTPFMAEFFWGGKPCLTLPVGPAVGDYPFEPRSDRPVLACNARTGPTKPESPRAAHILWENRERSSDNSSVPQAGCTTEEWHMISRMVVPAPPGAKEGSPARKGGDHMGPYMRPAPSGAA